MCGVDAEGNTLKGAALIGLDGLGVWAKSAAFPEVSQDELQTLLGYMAGTIKNETGTFLLAGQKYMMINSGDAEVKTRGKCSGGGCSIMKTNSALVIGICTDPPVKTEVCTKLVETLGEYLLSVGY